jgi:hypothetical protein
MTAFRHCDTASAIRTLYLVFVSGAALVVSALALFTFPEWVVGVVGLRIKPDTWNVVVGNLFTFFGAYGWYGSP